MGNRANRSKATAVRVKIGRVRSQTVLPDGGNRLEIDVQQLVGGRRQAHAHHHAVRHDNLVDPRRALFQQLLLAAAEALRFGWVGVVAVVHQGWVSFVWKYGRGRRIRHHVAACGARARRRFSKRLFGQIIRATGPERSCCSWRYQKLVRTRCNIPHPRPPRHDKGLGHADQQHPNPAVGPSLFATASWWYS